jgi:hypothetical protein
MEVCGQSGRWYGASHSPILLEAAISTFDKADRPLLEAYENRPLLQSQITFLRQIFADPQRSESCSTIFTIGSAIQSSNGTSMPGAGHEGVRRRKGLMILALSRVGPPLALSTFDIT